MEQLGLRRVNYLSNKEQLVRCSFGSAKAKEGRQRFKWKTHGGGQVSAVAVGWVAVDCWWDNVGSWSLLSHLRSILTFQWHIRTYLPARSRSHHSSLSTFSFYALGQCLGPQLIPGQSALAHPSRGTSACPWLWPATLFTLAFTEEPGQSQKRARNTAWFLVRPCFLAQGSLLVGSF